MESITSISPLELFVAAAVYFIFGGLWFTPLFGKFYDSALGIKRDKNQKWPAIYYYLPLLCSIAGSISIVWLRASLHPQSLVETIAIGLVPGLFGLSVSFNNALTPITPKPLLFGVVTGFYHLSSALIISALLFLIF